MRNSGCLSIAEVEAEVKALASIWRLGESRAWERFRIWNPEEGEIIIRPGEDLEDLLRYVRARIGDWFFSPHAYLPRGGRTEADIVQLNAIIIDLDNGDLEEALDRLRERGLKPHYIVGTSPGRWHLIIREEPVRLGRRNRERVLHRQREVVYSLYELTGGDLNAAKVGQLFRLPGSRRQLEDGVWEVRVWAWSDHPAYTLKRLERAVGVKGRRHRQRTFRGYRPAEKDILNSPAIVWLRNHTIAQGHRNTALVAICKAYLNAGYSLEQAEPEILEWVEERTAGPYPLHADGKRQDHRDPRTVIRSVFYSTSERRLAIDWRILATIRDINDNHMSEQIAKSIIRYLPKPKVKVQNNVRPVDQLRNRPLFESLMRVLEILAKLQLKAGKKPVEITNEELAARAEVPLGTLQTRVLPILNKTKIRKVRRRGRKYETTYDLSKLPPSPYNTYYRIFIIPNHALQGLFRRPIAKVVAYWAKRFRDLWNKFISLLKRISVVFGGARVEVGEGVGQDPGDGRPTLERSRGPPRRPPRAEDRADFGVQLDPVFPRRLERELEKRRRRAELLEEWSKLTPEEIERRKEARLEVARRWLAAAEGA